MSKKIIQDDELRTNSLTDFAANVTNTNDLSRTESMMKNLRFSAITNNRSLLTQLYVENGLVQTMIDAFVDDAFRGGIKIASDELSEEEISELEKEIEFKNILITYAQALKWARLFGGAGLVINCGQNTEKELNLDAITEKTPVDFYAADRWELSFTPKEGMQLDQFKGYTEGCPYNYYGKKLHHTRVIKLDGKKAPSLIRGQFSGWGMSEVERLIRSWNQYQKNQNVTYELLDEAKCDVFKINGFNTAISTKNGAEKTAKRIQIAAQIKNYQNALCLDKDDDYDSKQMTFSGLSEVLEQIRIGLACDVRMPLTRLFGISAAGFNSGEDDLEVYCANVESEVRSQCKQGLLIILKILCKKLFGYIPEHLTFEFKPLREMNEKDKSLIKTETLNRILTCFSNGIISNETAVELINNENIFSVKLDKSDSLPLEDIKELGQDLIDQADRGRG